MSCLVHILPRNEKGLRRDLIVLNLVFLTTCAIIWHWLLQENLTDMLLMTGLCYFLTWLCLDDDKMSESVHLLTSVLLASATFAFYGWIRAFVILAACYFSTPVPPNVDLSEDLSEALQAEKKVSNFYRSAWRPAMCCQNQGHVPKFRVRPLEASLRQ